MADPRGAEHHLIEHRPAGVSWHDLTDISRWDRIREIMLPLPWLVLSLGLYASPVWYLGAPASFMFYLCALRLNHEAIHSNLGLKRRGDRLVFHMLNFLMGGSNNAMAYGHLLHHKDTMGPQDFEGKAGHMPFWKVLFYGPGFIWEVNREAWRGSPSKVRRRILIDWALNLAMIAFSFGTGWQFLILHVLAMAVAQGLSAFFAVWITHQGAEDHGVIARSQRGPLARLAYLMFYHREHHLFPKVPVSRLPKLAERLDDQVPGYAASRLPVVRFLDGAE
ncbi:MAG: fatty acid desaturase [Pseudomonadota bacterium]